MLNINPLSAFCGKTDDNSKLVCNQITQVNNQFSGTDTSELPQVLESRISPEQMRVAAENAFADRIDFLITNAEKKATESSINLEQTQNLWNTQIVDKLGLKPKDEDKNKNINSEQLSALQFKALTEPNKIPSEIWETIPNKYFESKENKNNNEDELVDWIDTRPEPQVKIYETIKNNFKNSNSSGKNILKEINTLEKNNWSITFYEDDLFEQSPLNQQKTVYKQQLPITLKLSELQIEKLKNFQNTLLQNQEKSQTEFKQCFAVGEVLRSTKTVKNILEDSEYLRLNLLEPTKIRLEEAAKCLFPEPAIRAVLDQFKANIRGILNSACDLQSSALKDFKQNTQAFDENQKKFINKIMQKLVDQVVQSLETATGRQITNEYENLIPDNQESPLGAFTDEKDLSKEKKDLYNRFLEQLKGNSKLNFASLQPIMKEMQNVFFPENPKSITQNTTLNQNVDPSLFMRVLQDPVLELAQSSREVFDEVFAENKEKYNLLNVQLGFIPFETEPAKQQKLEFLLNTKRFEYIAQNRTHKSINFSPALLSRIKYLHYKLFKASKITEKPRS